jgi:hypothetical protein
MPESFAIADDQAAVSIATWRYFAFACENPNCKDGERFNRKSTYDEKDGKGYKYILEFYQLVWLHATKDLRQQAEAVTSQLQALLRKHPNANQARITVLDLVDKLLWQANGNPFLLGVVTPDAFLADGNAKHKQKG